jgi:hypothetical protein
MPRLPSLLVLTSILALPALAQEGSAEDPLGLGDIMKEVGAAMSSGSGSAGGNEMTYEGGFDQMAPQYVAGKPVTITHTGGNVKVRCADRAGLTARLSYSIRGTNTAAMESMGKGMGLAATGGASGGSVKSRVPSRPAGVKSADVELTINLPPEAQVTVVGGAGWVQVMGCKGTVKSSNSAGGAVISGTYSSVNVSSGQGDVSVELSDDSKLVGNNTISASGGAISLRLPITYAGKFTAKGTNVSVAHTVMGTNEATVVAGTINAGPASLTLNAPKGEVKVVAQ